MELKKAIQLVGLDLMLVVQRVPWKVAMMVVLMVSSMADLKVVSMVVRTVVQMVSWLVDPMVVSMDAM